MLKSLLTLKIEMPSNNLKRTVTCWSTVPIYVGLLFIILSSVGNATGYDCPARANQSLTESVIKFITHTDDEALKNTTAPKSCPSYLDASAKVFCCVNTESGTDYCCDLEGYIGYTWFVLLILVGILIIIGLLVCCFRCRCFCVCRKVCPC